MLSAYGYNLSKRNDERLQSIRRALSNYNQRNVYNELVKLLYQTNSTVGRSIIQKDLIHLNSVMIPNNFFKVDNSMSIGVRKNKKFKNKKKIKKIASKISLNNLLSSLKL